ncbi:hypothetical protein ACFU5D_34475 [Streptomyces anthocyanicus]|uniref:hypothetical protein n=1 Tax=Streptomyces anthocyanicus TaxID=68174 RepID=UPI0036CE073D
MPGPQAPNNALILLVVTVTLLSFAVGLAYITYEHPALAQPIAVATGGLAVLCTVFGLALNRK